MADVTTTFAAKDESFASTVDKLSGRLQGFQGQTQSFTSKVGNMASQFASFVGPIAAVGAAFLGARGIINSFRDAIDIGGKLNELSARTGETAGNLAILQRAFQNAGSSGEAVGPMLNRLQRFMVEAANGGKSQIEAMNKLGLSYETLKSMTPTAQMELLAQRIAAIPDPAQRSALAMEIFGRSGGEILPLLRNMSAELDTARAQLGSYPDVANKSAAALDSIGDSFTAISSKAQEFVAGALSEIAPTIARASEALAQMDFAGMGARLSEILLQAYDFFLGLWQNPSELLGLFGEYLNATFRQAGDSLMTAFATAGQFIANFFSELAASNLFGSLSEVVANAFIYATQRFNLAMFEVIQSVLEFYGTLWEEVTTQGTASLAQKLLDIVSFFASDFMQAMTNPGLFIAQQLGAALTQATTQAAEEYRFAFDAATGSYIEKVHTGLQAAVDGSGERLVQSSSLFGSTLVGAAERAAQNTEIIEQNLFGGAEAIERVNDRMTKIAANGAITRGEFEASAESAGQIKESLDPVPEHAKTLLEALADSFPLAAAIADEAGKMAQQGQLFQSSVNQAKIDAQITANIFAGLSDRMQAAVNSTSDMIDKMREAFHFGLMSEKDRVRMRDIEEKLRNAEKAKERAMDAAERRERAGQDRAAYEMRRRAEAEYTRKLEKLMPDLVKATDDARKSLEKGGKEGGDAVKKLSDEAGKLIKTGGESAGKALEKAADALKGKPEDKRQDLALEATLKKCMEFLRNIDRNLPQNALS
jgi:hypothetical protein